MRRGLLFLTFMLALASLPAVAGLPARTNPDGPLDLAQHQFVAGNYSAAISTLQSLIPQRHTDPQVFFWLARAYYELRDYDNAVTQGEQAVKLDPQNSNYHLWLGRAYGGKADRERSFFLARKTKKEFEEAVRLNPANVAARRDLEDFYLEAPWILGGSKEKAMEQVNAIAAKDPVEGHLAKAFFWRDARKLDMAEAEYGWVLQLKPNRSDSYCEVADFYVHQNDAAKLQKWIDAIAQVNPAEPRLAYYRGVAGILTGERLGEAEQYLKSYIASTPDRSDWPSHAAAREWLGRLYEKQGRRLEAAEQYRAAIQIDPERKSARERLKNLEKPKQ